MHRGIKVGGWEGGGNIEAGAFTTAANMPSPAWLLLKQNYVKGVFKVMLCSLPGFQRACSSSATPLSSLTPPLS